MFPNLHKPSPPLHEQVWCFPGFCDAATTPIFRVEVLKQPCEITFSIGQADKRLGGHLSAEDPHLPIFVKCFENLYSSADAGAAAAEETRQEDFDAEDATTKRKKSKFASEDIALVTVSSWAHTRDAVVGVKVGRSVKVFWGPRQVRDNRNLL